MLWSKKKEQDAVERALAAHRQYCGMETKETEAKVASVDGLGTLDELRFRFAENMDCIADTDMSDVFGSWLDRSEKKEFNYTDKICPYLYQAILANPEINCIVGWDPGADMNIRCVGAGCAWWDFENGGCLRVPRSSLPRFDKLALWCVGFALVFVGWLAYLGRV